MVLGLPVQSVPITIKVVSSNPTHGEMYSIQHYVIKFHLFMYYMMAKRNTVVSNHFHSVKILLFSSGRSRDFDEVLSAELLVSMYTKLF
jgi:hypothetical protein